MPAPKLIELLKLLNAKELKSFRERVAIDLSGTACKLLEILSKHHPAFGAGVPDEKRVVAQLGINNERTLDNLASSLVAALKNWLAEQELLDRPDLAAELYLQAVLRRLPGSALAKKAFAAYKEKVEAAEEDSMALAWRRFEVSYRELFAAEMAGQDDVSERARLKNCVEKLNEAYSMAAVRLDIEAKIQEDNWNQSEEHEIYFPFEHDAQSPFLRFQLTVRKALKANVNAQEFEQLCKRYFELLGMMTVEERYFTAIHLGSRMATNHRKVEGDEWLKMLPNFFVEAAQRGVFKDMGLLDINMFLNVLAFLTAQGDYGRAKDWFNGQHCLIPAHHQEDVKNISEMRMAKNLKNVNYGGVTGRKPNIAIRVYGHTILSLLADESENAYEMCQNFRKYLQHHNIGGVMGAPYLGFLAYAEILAKRKPGTIKEAGDKIKQEVGISHKRSLVWLFENLGK